MRIQYGGSVNPKNIAELLTNAQHRRRPDRRRIARSRSIHHDGERRLQARSITA
ncbi:MAG: hypothetical protein MZU79_02670 [Anaerotruncus sp.]|nr:hypothetical protein [Anaerotruncus sp.]